MQNNYEMIRMCILTFGLAGLSWEDMRKQELHGWAILLLGISGMTISLLGGCWKNPVWFLGLLPGIFMLILAWGTRESIGYGDGLVILGMGCFYALGEIMGIVMIAITIAGITALGLLVFGHKNRKSEFPFVPFLLGAHLVMWGLQG